MEEINLQLLNESLERVGKRELPKEELKEFIINTLKHEAFEQKKRNAMYSRGDFENELEINNYDYYGDSYRSGVYILLDDDAILPVFTDDGDEVEIKQLVQKKNGEIVFDNDGNPKLTERCFMRIKARTGYMSVFVGLIKVEKLEKDKKYVLVGGLTKKWKHADEESWDTDKKEGVEYYERPYYTFNIWQFGIVSQRGKTIKIVMPDVNWKEEKEKK